MTSAKFFERLTQESVPTREERIAFAAHRAGWGEKRVIEELKKAPLVCDPFKNNVRIALRDIERGQMPKSTLRVLAVLEKEVI